MMNFMKSVKSKGSFSASVPGAFIQHYAIFLLQNMHFRSGQQIRPFSFVKSLMMEGLGSL